MDFGLRCSAFDRPGVYIETNVSVGAISALSLSVDAYIKDNTVASVHSL